MMKKGFATVPAGAGTMILMLEPIIGTVIGLMLFQEIPSVIFLLGAAIMLTAIYISISPKLQTI